MSCYEQLENGRFKCKECPKTYTSKGSWKRHFQIIHQRKKFPCEFCNHKATRKDELQIHINAIHFQTKYHCRKCGEELASRRYFNKHFKRCLGKSSKSRMELLVSKFLKEHNITSIYDRSDEWMKEQTGFNGRFDFVIDNADPLFIELDGRQHFEPIGYFGGQETFEKQQRHDAIKNKFCRDNGFTLLRFKYDDTDEYIIGTIMLHLGMF